VRLGRILQLQTISAAPVSAGGVTVTPQARVLTVRLPFGGFVWNRPAAVLVEHAGQIERIPIVDLTRRAQLALLGFGVMLVLLARVRAKRRKEL
jgi:hypothetical protein